MAISIDVNLFNYFKNIYMGAREMVAPWSRVDPSVHRSQQS